MSAAGKLEDMNLEGVWNEYAERLLPPAETTGDFIRSELRKCFLAGAWTMLSLEERLRRESPERSHALLDRLRAEAEAHFRAMDERATS